MHLCIVTERKLTNTRGKQIETPLTPRYPAMHRRCSDPKLRKEELHYMKIQYGNILAGSVTSSNSCSKNIRLKAAGKAKTRDTWPL